MTINALMDDQIEPRIQFWSRRYFWPDDGPGQIFLARAVEKLGAVIHGGDWPLASPLTQLIWELPESLSLHTPIDEIWRAVPILREKCPTYRNRAGATLLTGFMPPDFPTRDEWAIAVAEMKMRSDQALSEYWPFIQISRQLAQACKAQEITSLTRPSVGGEFIEQPWWFWNTERAYVRCETCRVDPAAPFSTQAFAGSGDWIFLDTVSFERYCDKLATLSGEPNVAELTASETEIKAIKRSKPKGRKRGSQIDELAGIYFSKISSGEWSEEMSLRETSKRLADIAAETWQDPLDEGYIREKLTIWRQPRGGCEVE
jgi:hypothetical protein